MIKSRNYCVNGSASRRKVKHALWFIEYESKILDRKNDVKLERDIEQLQRKDYLRMRDMGDTARQAAQLVKFIGQMKTYQKALGLDVTTTTTFTVKHNELNTTRGIKSTERDNKEDTTFEWNLWKQTDKKTRLIF